MSKVKQSEEQKGLREQVDSNYFGIQMSEIVTLFDAYQRIDEFDKDIVEADKLGGGEAIIAKLRTSLEKGISTSDPIDLGNRIKTFGENKIPQEEMPHCCEFVWEGLEDLMIRLLILAAIFQIVVGSIPEIQESTNDWIEGVSIVVAVVVVVSVGSITNFSKEKKFRELNDRNNSMKSFTVRRNGQVVTLKEEEILVGEIIKAEVGMVLPADGILIEGNDIKVEEASLTGESDLIEKEPLEYCKKRVTEEIENHHGEKPNEKHLVPSPLVFSGTMITEGAGWFVALRIGPNSEKGKIQMQVIAEQEKGKGGSKSSDSENKKDNISEKGSEIDNNNPGEKKEESQEEEEENDDEGKTPLEIKLDVLANDVGFFGIASAVATFIVLFIKLIYNYTEEIKHSKNDELYYTSNWYNVTVLGEVPHERELPSGSKVGIEFIRMLILCIAIIVVAIPEGLPLAVTLSLAFSIGKMMEDNNLVRKMNACETMGGATYICSDKTGTLTKNEMSVETFFDGIKEKNFKALTSNKSTIEDPLNYFTKDYYSYFKDCLCLNTDVDLDDKENIVKGSKTDFSFIHLLHNFGEKIFTYRQEQFGSEEIRRFPFTSTRKKMSTIHNSSKYGTGHVMYTKGASEIILNCCKYFLNEQTAEREVISDEKLQVFKSIIKNFADRALRTICIAYKEVTDDEVERWKEKDSDSNIIEKENFVLIGIFGIKDQLRDGVEEAVDICHNAGITVVMVTGDNIDTANAIARDCHILNDDLEREAKEQNKQISFTGKEFYERIGKMVCDECGVDDLKFCLCARTETQAKQMLEKKRETDPDFQGPIKIRRERIGNMEEFKKICRDIRVIARSRPEDKYTMVYGLRELDEVVAVTGDGTNDAPALSKSDVGFAMGISGTDIAKQAADIIILNDNFATIVQAVKWGRNIYDNIRKFIQFQLTVNICACFLVFLSCAIGTETPLNAIQMLWLNLIMDSLGSLALATEAPSMDLLNRKPYPKTEYIINSLMWKHIFYQAMIELAIMLILYQIGHTFIPESNEYNIKIANTLISCYGYIPGQKGNPIQNPNLIIAAPSQHWEVTTERLPNASPSDCKVISPNKNYPDINFYTSKNLEIAHTNFLAYAGSVHLNIIFNTFVIYTLFNQLNARSIDGSYNIFADMHKNFLFIIIIICEMGLQAIIVQVGGIVFKISVNGLDGYQWGICYGFGTSTLFFSVLIKAIPFQKCFDALSVLQKRIKGEEVEEVAQEEPEKVMPTHVSPSTQQGHDEVVKVNSKAVVGVTINKNQPQPVNKHESEPNNHNQSQGSQSQQPSSRQGEAKRQVNSTLLNLRRPSRQLTNRGQSKMRSIKD